MGILMARLFVTRNDPDAKIWVEITTDPETGALVAECSECPAGNNLVADTNEQLYLADTVAVAERHVEEPHRD